jgi:hypothetical protein
MVPSMPSPSLAATPLDVVRAERAAMHARVRAELRAAHRRLTDRQIDLIADVTVELRLTRVRLQDQASSAEP